MNARTPVVMLPGMDGTGDLFQAFITTCPPEFEAIVLRYSCDQYENTEDLLARIARALPQSPAIMVAESFSGGLAVRFAAQQPQRVKALVLCNTFIHSPAPWIARMVPWRLAMRLRPSPRVLRRFLVGADASTAVIEQVRSAIGRVKPEVLASRLHAILTEDTRSFATRISVPVLYLRGTEDAVVSARSVRGVLTAIPGARLSEVAGPHLLLQVRPDASWAEIQRFAS